MSIVKILHDTAMDFYDQAKLSKMKGEEEMHHKLLEKAFLLEREAALKLPIEENDNYWQYMLIRSAGWLALQCNEHQEALQLAHWGLAGEPPAYEKSKLEDLLKSVQEQIPATNRTAPPLRLYGFLSSADMDKGIITIRTTENNQYHIVKISKVIIQKTARYLIGEVVQINGSSDTNGGMVVEEIKRVAA